MKPFNLKAAKRGEPICTDGGLVMDFVGVLRNGDVVVETDEVICHYDQKKLRMAPKKRTVWVNFYECGDSGIYAVAAPSKDKAEKLTGAHRIGGKAYPVEIDE